MRPLRSPRTTFSLSLLTLLSIPLLHCSASTREGVTQSDEALRPIKGGGDDGSDPPPPHSSCYIDGDRDGLGAPGRKVTIAFASCSNGYSNNGADCDDTNANVTYGSACYRDADGDGLSSGVVAQYSCGACPAGTTAASSGDCNDSNASIGTMYCYADRDHDGYPGGVVAYGSSCPASCGSVGLSDSGSDCNDYDQTVHPWRDEVGGNSVDDDCNQLVDEATFTYARDTSAVTPTSMRLATIIHEAATAAYARTHGQLWAYVDYAPLTHSRDVVHVGPLAVALSEGPSAQLQGSVLVEGLSPSTPYQATLRFTSDASGSTRFPTAGEAFEPWMEEQTARDLGPTGSATYYTMTLASTSDTVDQARPLIVLRALYDWNEFVLGHQTNGNAYCVGYDCDMSHTGGHMWCSEFYNVTVHPWFVDLDPYSAGIDYDVTNVRGTFVSYNSYWPYRDASQLATLVRPGDFLGEGTPSNTHHSAMFIAYDASVGHTWHLSGNVANRVGFGRMQEADPGRVIAGIGHLAPTMRR